MRYTACQVDETTGQPKIYGDMPVEDIEAVEQMASDFLSLWTGQTFGACPVSIRPCRTKCPDSGYGPLSMFYGTTLGYYGQYRPALIGGSWYNIMCGACQADECSCDKVPMLKIPGPVVDIESIMIDGQALPSGSYRVDNWHLLIRLDGQDWPKCQDMTAGEDEEGSFVINYSKGVEVPVGGQVAAGLLAQEFAKALCKDKSCALPQRLQQITRQGVSMTMLDDWTSMKEGQTGIWLIDSWVQSVTMPRRASTVHSPDIPRHSPRTTTWRA
jgi:hypothetical protein